MKVAFLTLGCKVNFYETEKMMEQFQSYGFSVVEFREKADVYVINTCTVTNMADRKSRQMIHRAKKLNPESLVVAVGCYVESGGEELLRDSAIDAAFSNKEKETIVSRMIEKFQLNCSESEGKGECRRERTRAYLKIQDGCNQFCTYCMIPYVRGGGILTSTPPEEVVEQAEKLAAGGYKEIVLTGIHLSSYGVDRSEEINFVRLKGEPLLDVIRRVAEVEGIERIRLGSLEPRIISENFLEKLVQIEKACPHFHLSLQSGCDSVLKRMNRHYTTAEYKEKVKLLREYYENPAITTDVIVGFPGETEEEFDRTQEYLKEIQLADIHVFKYSPRSGTKAAAMENQVSPDEKNKRSDRLLEDTEQYRNAFGKIFMGRKEKILFEETTSENGVTYLVGHNERYVKIGVPLEEAEKRNYHENEIHPVTVEKIFSK